MRKHLLKLSYLLILCISFLLTSHTTFAQSPQGIKYQAVVRDAGGIVIANTSVNLTIKILQGSTSGTAVCTELFTPTTNGFGLVNLELGSVSPVEFAAISWSAGPYFIEVSLNGNILGTSQLLSVPYAMYAKNAGTVNETDPIWIGDSSNYYTKLNLQTPYGAQLHFENITGFPNKIPKLLAPPVKGDMCAWDGTKWVNVVPGSEGEILVTDTAGMPAWLALSASAPSVGDPILTDIGNSFAVFSTQVTVAGKTVSNNFDYGNSANVPLIMGGTPGQLSSDGFYMDTLSDLVFKQNLFYRSHIIYHTLAGDKTILGSVGMISMPAPAIYNFSLTKSSFTSQSVSCDIKNADNCQVYVEWKSSEDSVYTFIMPATPSNIGLYESSERHSTATITNLIAGSYNVRFFILTNQLDTIRSGHLNFESRGGPIIEPLYFFNTNTTCVNMQSNISYGNGCSVFLDYKRSSDSIFSTLPFNPPLINSNVNTTVYHTLFKLHQATYNCRVRIMTPTGDTVVGNTYSFNTQMATANFNTNNITLNSVNITGSISNGQVSKILLDYATSNNNVWTSISIPPDSIRYNASFSTPINYTLSNLIAGMDYKVRIKLITEVFDTIYSPSTYFRTLGCEITTNPATNIKYRTVKLNGTINPNGAKVYNIGFRYGSTASSLWDIVNYTLHDTISGNVPINIEVDANIWQAVNWGECHFKLVASSSSGDYSGEILSYSDISPILQTTNAINITKTSALLQGNINNNNCPVGCTTYWLWGYNQNSLVNKNTGPTMAANDKVNVSISSQIQGITGSMVYFRLISVNTNNDTAFSNISNFSTISPLVLSVLSPSQLSCNSASLNGSITKQEVPTNVWFEINNTIYYVLQNPVQPSPSTFNVNSYITGLTANSDYIFRMGAANIQHDTVWSSLISFSTQMFALQDSLNKGIRPAALIGMGANAYDFNGLNFPAEGGIIYYMNPNGSGSVFYNSTALAIAYNPGACSGTNCGNTTQSGAINTGFMIASGCAISGTAAYVAHNLNYAGHTDWFLPSSSEVSYMHNAIQSQPALKAKYPSIDIFTSNVVESNYSEFWMYNLGTGGGYTYPYNVATAIINIIPCRSFPQ